MRHVSRSRPSLLVVPPLAMLLAVSGLLSWLVAVSCGAIAGDDDWPDEADRLMQELALTPGMTVGEIGAGRGDLTIEMARRLGPRGRVFSTEIDAARLADIRRAAKDASLDNISVITAGERDANLPDACCDAIYMREVFHHFADPTHTTASLRRALKPGGLLAVIDYPQRGSPGSTCHCIDKAELIRLVTAQGFEVVREKDRWAEIRYLVVFRRGPS